MQGLMRGGLPQNQLVPSWIVELKEQGSMIRPIRDGVQWLAVGIIGAVLGACGGGGGGGHSNSPPIAVAGSAQTVAKRALVTLDGSASHDPDGSSITYSWKQTAGPSVTLSSTISAKPQFTAPDTAASFSFSLTVNDGQTSSTAATTTVTVINHAPVASAGDDATVAAGGPVALDGMGSSDADHDPLGYRWTQTAGPNVSLSSATSANPTFVAPNVAAVLQFSLVVNDGEADSASATVTVTVKAPNRAPSASAGSAITTPKRAVVTLYGVGSDPQGLPLTYQWTQTAGTMVILQSTTGGTVQFAAPATTGDLKFSLTVSDGTLSSLPSTVTVHVQNFAPYITSLTLSSTAPRRNDQITVQVDGGDPDQDPVTLSYVWTRNGTVVPAAAGAAYPLGNQVKNDVIAVTVTESDGTSSVSKTASVTIADTPAVLTGTAPTSVNYGQAVSFQITASDADGDPTGAIEVAYGPAGFAVNSSGTVTWTPSGPLFEQATDMAWRVRLHNAPNIGMGGTITVNDSARQYPLARGTVATPLSGASIDVQDFDGNGQREILIGSSTSLYMLTKSGAADYIQSWVYPYDPRAEGNFVSPGNSGFDAVASGDVDGDGHREIFFALGPVIVKLDGVTRREVARYGNQGTTAPFGPYCTSLKYGDIDNDGVGELVCLGNDGGNGDPTHIYVLDARTMTLKWQSGALAGGTSLALGNVVGGSGLQIVTSDGYVFDGTTHQNLWAYGPGFGSVIDVGDVSGDGVAKIVGVDPSGNAVVFSATLKSPIWQITTPSATGTSALKVANLDGTGPAEILLGDGQWGDVRVYRYNTGTHVADAVSQINAVGDGVTAIAAGDVDGDGQMEMIWGEAWGALPPRSLAIASWATTPVIKWQGPDTVGIDGPFVGAKNAAIGAGQNRIMFATPNSSSGYAGERIIALDPATASLTLSSEIDSNWSHDRAFDVANVTGGSTDSILLGTATLYQGYFAVYDFAGDAKTWTSAQVGDGVAVTHADLNHDSVDDVIGITSQGYVYAWDVHHQTLLWTSTQLSGGRDVAAVDLDGDGVPEIIALDQTRVVVYKYAGAAGYVEAYSYMASASNLLVADTDGDGVPEIFLLNAYSLVSGDGTITQLNGSLQVLHQYMVPFAQSLDLEQSAFGRKNLIVSIANPNLIYNHASRIAVIDPTAGTMIWQSPYVIGSVPAHSVSFYDWNGDGQLEMAFGTDDAMYVTR
jgi:hypothetical protein